MERIKKLLEHIVTSAKISGDTDVAFAANVLLGSIERNCVDELADELKRFTTNKVHEIIFIEQCEKLINENKN